jgi:hypothetical protein
LKKQNNIRKSKKGDYKITILSKAANLDFNKYLFFFPLFYGKVRYCLNMHAKMVRWQISLFLPLIYEPFYMYRNGNTDDLPLHKDAL